MVCRLRPPRLLPGIKLYSLGAAGRIVQNPSADVRGEAKVDQFSDENVWDYGTEGHTIIYKKHPHTLAPVLQVVVGHVESHSNGILPTCICSICKLERVQGQWETGFLMGKLAFEVQI